MDVSDQTDSTGTVRSASAANFDLVWVVKKKKKKRKKRKKKKEKRKKKEDFP